MVKVKVIKPKPVKFFKVVWVNSEEVEEEDDVTVYRIGNTGLYLLEVDTFFLDTVFEYFVVQGEVNEELVKRLVEKLCKKYRSECKEVIEVKEIK